MAILIDRAIKENFSNYEFLYQTEIEKNIILGELYELKKRSLVKGDITVIPGSYRDNYAGAVWSCVDNNVIETLQHVFQADFETAARCITLCAVQDDDYSISSIYEINPGIANFISNQAEFNHGATFILASCENGKPALMELY